MAANQKNGTIALDDLWDELKRGRVYECSLRDTQFHLDGLQDGENVYIDPRCSVLETVVHELLHRRKPRLGERTVTKEAKRLISRMDEPTKAKWWRAYNRIKRKGRPVELDRE